jgi:hypothetical protein
VPTLGSTDPLSHFAAEIALLGRKREVGVAAVAVYEAPVALDRFAWDDEVQNPGASLDQMDAPMDEKLAAYDVARTRFLAAAKGDLGAV